MPGDHLPDAPPPELPEEFAAAYREAYRRALEAEAADRPAPPVVPPQEAAATGGDQVRSDPAGSDPPGAFARWRGSAWFLPSVVVAGGLVLVAAAYGLGAALGNDDQPEVRGATPQVTRTTGPARSQSPSADSGEPKPSSAPGGWTGPVSPVGIDAISADCTASPGTDSAGHPVSYVPENAIDRKAQTAWRCDGTAVGQKLTLRLAASSDVAEVALIPGYAKTDAASGVDRYAENNRITRVRWTFGDGASVVQRLDPDPASRRLQAIRVPRTSTDTVTLEILAVRRGSRDTTAISEIRLAAAKAS